MAKEKLSKKGKSKSFAQISQKILSSPINEKDFERLKISDGTFDCGATHDEVIISAIVRKAMDGDIKAVQYIRELAQELLEDGDESNEMKIKFTLKIEGDKGE